MITSRTVTREIYNVVCGKCGEHGPDGYSTSEAIYAAQDENWESREIFPGGELVVVWTCAECLLE